MEKDFDLATRLWRGIETKLVVERWGKRFKGKILDLGCGEGRVTEEVVGRKVRWGLDNDREMVKKARKRKIYDEVILAEAGKIPLKGNSVDLVWSNSVLEHIKDLEKALLEISRVLKQGGELIATMPSDKLGEYLGWGRTYSGWFNKKYQHYHLYSLKKWGQILNKYGLKMVDSYYYLDQKAIRIWHKWLWMNKLGLRPEGKIEGLIDEAKNFKVGAAVAIRAEKL